MSYALETKKRKFHRVLESLTRPSKTESSKPGPQTPATHLDHAPSAKRVRLNGRDDDLIASVRKDIPKIARPPSRASSVSSQTRPTFVPWDRDRFLERLETFRRVDRWPPKPAAVNEVEWAKRGWICTDVARVTCVGGCGGSVVVKIPDELDELDGYDSEKIQERKEVRMKLVQEYENLMVQEHGGSCPWRNKGCDATIHRLQLANPDTAVSGLRTRYSHLVEIVDQLPDLGSLQTPEGFSTEDIISILPDDAFKQSNSRPGTAEAPQPELESGREDPSEHPIRGVPSVNTPAFVLAFFGWDSVDGAPGLAACSACFRRLGLWIYKPKDKGDAPALHPLDVVNEHMEYCPWINGKAQSGSGKPSEKTDALHSGWEVLAQALRVKHLRQIRTGASIGSRAGSEAPLVEDPVIEEPHDDAKRAQDREWWAKIRRIRQVLNAKPPKKKPSTAQ
ncbi:uncharacterized protein BJX67DRAFT_286351 [Aspergillus lucknowensis]|uniref:C3HC zinc finger-like-domain-containing protein n=1 Tax=Aspergillus lucknowensis TaxID=176173 RepID=A0ABR4M188_9EURO